MQPLRIGVVNFLNAYPLWGALEGVPNLALFPDVPSQLALKLRAGNLDAALISSVEYLRHREGFRYHPQLCVAAINESRSIRLFVRNSTAGFRESARNLRRIFTDAASRSSVAQLRVILHALGFAPQLEEITGAGGRIASLADGEALLAIGDTALLHMAEASYDLQKEYFNLFARGFVYALWVFHNEKAAELEELLLQAYRRYRGDTAVFWKKASERFGFGETFVAEYLTDVIQHELSPERQQDLQFFASRLARLSP